MNTFIYFWTLAFFAFSLTLLLVPFYPTWREWRHPVDACRLTIQDLYPAHLEHAMGQLRLTSGSMLSESVSANISIFAPSGSHFQKLCAPTILLGTAHAAPLSLTGVQIITLIKPDRAKQWGDKGWRIDGDCCIPDAHHLQNNLVVTGSLHIGADCVIQGDIKAHGAVHIGPRSQLNGSLFSTQAITLRESAIIQGPVISEKSVSIGSWVLIGNLFQASMVSAPQIVAQSGAVVHGKVWSIDDGRVT